MRVAPPEQVRPLVIVSRPQGAEQGRRRDGEPEGGNLLLVSLRVTYRFSDESDEEMMR
jgi:hypothetical protein